MKNRFREFVAGCFFYGGVIMIGIAALICIVAMIPIVILAIVPAAIGLWSVMQALKHVDHNPGYQ